jgi:hypothetical protein
MGKLTDILKVVKVGLPVAKVFVPGGVGQVLDVVNKSIADDSDPANEEALRTLAKVNDEQTEAILALHARVKKLEGK